MTKSQQLVQLAMQFSSPTRDDLQPTLAPGLHIIRGVKGRRTGMLLKPSIVFVLQGSKNVFSGSKVFKCDAGRIIAAGTSLPTTGIVTVGSEKAPYLCLLIEIEQSFAIELMRTLPEAKETALQYGLQTDEVNEALTDALLRLMNALKSKSDSKILAPLIMREIVYRFLSRNGQALIQLLGSPASRMQSMRSAFAIISEDFRVKLDMAKLARRVGMSEAVFYRNFKLVCGLSPLQYQKQLRLQEARRLLRLGVESVTTISYEVGYESPSQFGREYHRLFGRKPSEE